MKVLLASPIGKAGGIARWTEHILGYYENLDKDNDCNITHLPMSSSGNHNIGKQSILQRIKRGISTYYKVAKQEREILDKDKFDIIHIASSASISLAKDIIMIKIAKKRDVKTVLHFHFGRIPELAQRNNWEWKLICYTVKLADIVVVIDKKSYDVLRNEGFGNIRLLPNPVSPRALNVIDSVGNIKREDGVILFVGHGIQTKGVYELIDACRDIPNIRVKMLGTISESMIDKLCEYSNHATWLEIYGEIPYEEVIMEMLKCDIFVLPTYTEGFPNVILESMACGCPIVTTCVGAIPEMLSKDGNKCYGIMVEPRSSEHIHSAIKQMLNDKNFKESCGKNAKQRVITKYNINSVWTEMFNIWSQLLS